MTIQSHSLRAAAYSIGRRSVIALTVAIAGIAAVLSLLRYDLLGVYGVHKAGLPCISLGMPQQLCHAFETQAVPKSILSFAIIVAAILALGLYDPQPVISRLEQSRRPRWWLLGNAAGTAIFVSPYLLAAAGVPPAEIAPWAPYLMLLGSIAMALGLLLWLADPRDLAEVFRPYHVLVLLAAALVSEPVKALASLGWDNVDLREATLNMTSLVLRAMGQNAEINPGDMMIGIGGFHVIMAYSCAGFSGIAMVSAVIGGYVLLLRQRLWVARAILLVPLAAGLSWLLNAVRIAVLVLIGAYVSPELAVEGFHTHAGWLAFCVLSVLMLLAAENIAWIHRDGSPKEPHAVSLVNDPVVAQIVPFIVLLVSSLLAGAAFTRPEMGYPLRAFAMALAVFAFRPAYRSMAASVDAPPFVAGALLAVIWAGVKAGGTALTLTDILGPVSASAAVLWILIRVAGTVLLVPLIEENFFRGYLLRQLDFGGLAGKITALALSSALFGALHADILLAAASGVLFGLLALRRGRLADAVAAHATANACIAAWAVWTGDWSVI